MKVKVGALKVRIGSNSSKSVFVSAGTYERQSEVETVLNDEVMQKAISAGHSPGSAILKVTHEDSYKTSDFIYEKSVTRIGEVELGADLAVGMFLQALADKRFRLPPGDAAKILLAVSKAINR